MLDMDGGTLVAHIGARQVSTFISALFFASLTALRVSEFGREVKKGINQTYDSRASTQIDRPDYIYAS